MAETLSNNDLPNESTVPIDHTASLKHCVCNKIIPLLFFGALMNSTRRQSSQRTIISRLKSASRWLGGQTTYSQQGEAQARQLVEGCVFLLSQSVRSYRRWTERNSKKIRGKYTSPPNKLALQRLVALTISDMEACTWIDYQSAWQLEDYPKDKLPKSCPGCGNGHFQRYTNCGRECPGRKSLAA